MHPPTQALLKTSEKVMGHAREKEATSLPRSSATAAAAAQHADAAAAAADGEGQSLLQESRRQQQAELAGVESSLQFNDAIIEERDAAITEISGQIGEVHQIFQDLAVLVSDQGLALDDIEANITRAAERTGGAHTQILRAERSQRSSRNRWCFLSLLAAGVVGVLLLIVLA